MKTNNVRIEHAAVDPAKNGGWDMKARVWVEDVEIVGADSYQVDAGIDHGIGVYQKCTITFWARVSIEQAQAIATEPTTE